MKATPPRIARWNEAFRETPNLALVSLFQGDPVRWEDPKPEFGRWAKAIGHAYAQPDESDSVTRSIPLEMRAGRDRRWPWPWRPSG